MIWALHHLAQPEMAETQRVVRSQARAVLARVFPRASSSSASADGTDNASQQDADNGAREEEEAHVTLGAVADAVPSLDPVLRETLRLYSPIHIGRVALADDEVPCRGTIHRLVKGTDVAANYWFLHRDPSYWERPDEFVPSRWVGVAPNAHGAHYGPFSKGLRGCPGQRVAFVLMKAALAAVIGERELCAPTPSAAAGSCPAPRFKQSVVLPNTPEHVYARYSDGRGHEEASLRAGVRRWPRGVRAGRMNRILSF